LDSQKGHSEEVQVTKLKHGRPSKAAGKVVQSMTMKGISKVRYFILPLI
jgi:hypothetical protein